MSVGGGAGTVVGNEYWLTASGDEDAQAVETEAVRSPDKVEEVVVELV